MCRTIKGQLYLNKQLLLKLYITLIARYIKLSWAISFYIKSFYYETNQEFINKTAFEQDMTYFKSSLSSDSAKNATIQNMPVTVDSLT